MPCRFDKYCWSVRLTKTRSLATENISKGRIKLDGLAVKPAKEIRVGSIISVFRHNAEFKYKVLDLIDKRVGPKLVENYLLDIKLPEEVEKFKTYRVAQSAYREYGTGKPSKKDRRDLDSFLDEWV